MQFGPLRRAAALLGVIAAVGLALSACGSSNSTSSTSGGSSSSASSGSSVSSSSSSKKVPTETIGVWQSMGSGAGIAQTLAAVKSAAAVAGWKLVITDSNGEPNLMASTMSSLVDQHVNAIIAIYVDTGATASELAAAKAANIPVISAGFQATPSPDLTAEYAPNQGAMAKLLVARMHKDLPSGGVVAPISVSGYYGLDEETAALQKSGPADGFKPLQELDVPVDNLYAGTTTAALNVLNGNPKLAAFYSELDVDVQNIEPALAQTGRTVPVYGFGAIPEALKYIREGKAVVVAADNGESGFLAINALLAYFVNKTPIPKTTPSQYAFKYQIVDKANAPSGDIEFPQSAFAAPFLAAWKTAYGI
jgi:ribose transport system substrate-binding protein